MNFTKCKYVSSVYIDKHMLQSGCLIRGYFREVTRNEQNPYNVTYFVPLTQLKGKVFVALVLSVEERKGYKVVNTNIGSIRFFSHDFVNLEILT